MLSVSATSVASTVMNLGVCWSDGCWAVVTDQLPGLFVMQTIRLDMNLVFLSMRNEIALVTLLGRFIWFIGTREVVTETNLLNVMLTCLVAVVATLARTKFGVTVPVAMPKWLSLTVRAPANFRTLVPVVEQPVRLWPFSVDASDRPMTWFYLVLWRQGRMVCDTRNVLWRRMPTIVL